jgi:aspartyl-tRNA(Asn)/glutamyl-tRNA(Gln) amidotransferase subunit C
MLDSTKLQKIAKLARIEIGKDDDARIIKLLNRDIEGVKGFHDVNTDNLEALINPYDMYLEVHKDEVTDGNKQEEVMRCAPESMYNYFIVPKVIE